MGVGLVRGVRVDVNAMLGVGGDVGYGRCGGRVGVVRVDVNEELKFLRKLTKKEYFFWGGVGGLVRGGGGSGWM